MLSRGELTSAAVQGAQDAGDQGEWWDAESEAFWDDCDEGPVHNAEDIEEGVACEGLNYVTHIETH